MNAIIDFDGVRAAYRARDVLVDVTFTIEAGERVAIIGPNGAGKSSLLRAMTGTLQICLSFVMLFALPIPICPFAIHGSFSGESTITSDNLIHSTAVNHIVIDIIAHI